MLQRVRNFIREQVDAIVPKMGFYRTQGLRFRRCKSQKTFCIGRNKTGTTSLKTALSDLGYRVGDQRRAERLIRHYRDRDFQPIINYCRTAEAFQDVPFSLTLRYMVTGLQ